MNATGGVIAVDIGSSSLRVSLFLEDLASVDTLTEKHFANLNPDVESWWNAVEAMIRRLVRDHGAIDIRSIGVSSMLGWVLVDADGRPTCPAFSWMDHKPEQHRAALSRISEADFSARTGRRMSPELGGFKLSHLKDEDGGAYARTARILSIKDYMNYRLCGAFCMDRTTACYTGLFNIHTLSWDPVLCAAMGIDETRLPALLDGCSVVGRLDSGRARALGLNANTVVAGCGPDGSVAVLGGGGMRPGDAVSVMGTSDVFFAVTGERVLDENRHVVTNPHVLPGLWLLGGPLGMAGGALDWYARTLLEDRRSLDELTIAAARIAPGSEDLFFVPGLTGERTPFWNAAARGTVIGLTREHGSAHLFRALMEANSYTIRRIIDVLVALHAPVSRMYAIGGGAENDLWLEIKADVCGIGIDAPVNQEATSRGAALLAWLSVRPGIPMPPAPAMRRSHEPDTRRSALYEPFYRRYLKIVKLCESLYE